MFDDDNDDRASVDEGLRSRIADEILRAALAAGERGITINECAEQLPIYKAWSISPMFKPLVRKGLLVRHEIGRTRPSRLWPNGKEILETRLDPHTHKLCIVNCHHSIFGKPSVSKEKGRQERRKDAS